MTSSAARSKPKKLSFTRNGRRITYEVFLSAPVINHINQNNLEKQMERDGLPPRSIHDDFRTWMQDRTDVRKLALSYADRRYSLAVLVHELSEEQVTKTYTQLQGIAQSYPRFRPIIYVLGPNQAHSILLNDDGIQLFNEQ